MKRSASASGCALARSNPVRVTSHTLRSSIAWRIARALRHDGFAVDSTSCLFQLLVKRAVLRARRGAFVPKHTLAALIHLPPAPCSLLNQIFCRWISTAR